MTPAAPPREPSVLPPTPFPRELSQQRTDPPLGVRLHRPHSDSADPPWARTFRAGAQLASLPSLGAVTEAAQMGASPPNRCAGSRRIMNTIERLGLASSEQVRPVLVLLHRLVGLLTGLSRVSAR